MHFILSSKCQMYTARGWPVRPKQVAMDKTNKICCGWRQRVCQF